MLAVLNIITSVFVDKAVETARAQHETRMQKEMELKEADVTEMHTMFAEIDEDCNGTLTMKEVQDYFGKPKMQLYFQALGIDATDSAKLFSLLDDEGSGEVEVDAFIEGCLRLKGAARSIDVFSLI